MDAAARRFVERGYLGTTMEAIADSAGVAVQTVYYVFGTKRNVLASVLDVQIAGNADTVPVARQTWVDEIAAVPHAHAALELLAERAVGILARAAPIYDVVRRAASDPEIAELLTANRAARRSDQRRLIELLGAAGHLRPGLDVETAADILYGLLNEEVFLLLTADCGWSTEQFGRWVTAVLVHELVRDAHPAR